MEWITTWLNGIPDTWLRVFAIAGPIIGLLALGLAGFQMFMSRCRYKKLKKTQDRIVDYLHREFDVRLDASATFVEPEMTVSVGKRREKKPTFPLTLRRLLGKLFP